MITLTLLLILLLFAMLVILVCGLPIIDVLVAVLIIVGIIKLFRRKKD